MGAADHRHPQISLTALSIFAAVTATAMRFEYASAGRAVLIGLAAMALAAALESLGRGASWETHGAASPVALGSIALALCVSDEVVGFGLDPAHATLAVIAGGATGLLLRALAARRSARERVLIVGGGAVADALRTALSEGGRRIVVGRLDDDRGEGVLGRFDQLERVARSERVDVVAFAYSRSNDQRLARVAGRCRELDLPIAVVPRLFEQFDTRSRLSRVSGMPLLIVDPAPHEARMPNLSRVLDVIGASLLLLLTFPLWVLIALAIVIEEPGPVLYRARRAGRHGREFSMLKFRKMRRDAAGPRLTRQDDERFTRVGRFLTRTKLDELPQLINVLRGEMALVGPRPEDPMYVDMYPREFGEIHRCRPGITGLSQIQYRDEAPLLVGGDFENTYRNVLLPKKMDLDRYYASRRCLGLDARIMVWTLVAIVKGAHVRRHALTHTLSFERNAPDFEPGLALAHEDETPETAYEVA
ncbi:MAG TPA: sugar transferase [Gaiellales bacterium]